MLENLTSDHMRIKQVNTRSQLLSHPQDTSCMCKYLKKKSNYETLVVLSISEMDYSSFNMCNNLYQYQENYAE